MRTSSARISGVGALFVVAFMGFAVAYVMPPAKPPSTADQGQPAQVAAGAPPQCRHEFTVTTTQDRSRGSGDGIGSRRACRFTVIAGRSFPASPPARWPRGGPPERRRPYEDFSPPVRVKPCTGRLDRRGNCTTGDIETLLRQRHPDLAFDADPEQSFLALS
jgi:hypothetical protein